jgi:WD40 repeat protein
MPGLDASPHFLAMQIAPHGERIYLIDMRGRLHIWDLVGEPGGAEMRAQERDPNLPLAEPIFSFSLRRDGSVLAARDRTGTVTLIDIPRRAVLGTISPPADEAGSVFSALAFSPDGQTLANGSHQGSISLYSVASPARPRLRLRLPGHRGLVTNLAFDTDGTRLASTAGNRLGNTAGTDPVVEVWDLDLIGRELARLGLGEVPRD